MMLAISPPVEKELLTRLKSGDRYAFEQLYHAYSRKIYGKLLRLTVSETIADELLQDTFVILWEKRHMLDVERSFKSWLYKVAQNEVYQLYRRLSKERKLQEHLLNTYNEAYHHLDDIVDVKETRELIDRAMEQLPPQRRLVFSMCKMEGKSYDQVAVELGISTNTVSVHMVKASRAVRDYIFRSNGAALMLVFPVLFNIF